MLDGSRCPLRVGAGHTRPSVGFSALLHRLSRKRISEQFHLAELRDPNLTARSHRQVYALPRQLAMYLVRRLTGASLEEIGRQFGGRHHTSVLHSINKIEELLCHSHKALAKLITQMLGGTAS